MWVKIIFVVATLCVVNASIITADALNGLEAANQNEVEESDFVLNEEEILEDVSSVMQASPRNCNPQECNQRCRRLKFPGGVCVNGRCKCDNFLYSDDSELEVEESLSRRSCILLQCRQHCNKLGFVGACLGGRCQCLGQRPNGLKLENDEIENLDSILNEDESRKDVTSFMQESPRSCNPQECNQRCRRLKFPGGACVNGRCKCDNFRNSDGIVDEAADSSLNPDNYSRYRNCKPNICNRHCRFLRFKNGTCINSKCQCSRIQGSTNSTTQKPVPERKEEVTPLDEAINNEDEESNLIVNEGDHHEDFDFELEQSSPARGCNFYECQKYCSRYGFYPVCKSGRCKCYTSKPKKPALTNNDIEEETVNEDDNTEEPTPTNNDIEDSEVIVNNEDDTEAQHDRVARATCYQYKCNDSCIRVGYAGGLCTKRKCNCY